MPDVLTGVVTATNDHGAFQLDSQPDRWLVPMKEGEAALSTPTVGQRVGVVLARSGLVREVYPAEDSQALAPLEAGDPPRVVLSRASSPDRLAYLYLAAQLALSGISVDAVLGDAERLEAWATG